jgi:hypothetical protein
LRILPWAPVASRSRAFPLVSRGSTARESDSVSRRLVP